ncbi:Clp protease N-terminal domain-containing protein [Kibdelosporangium persicum]|uniref:Clp amino terminal domain-containing protein, pathogenicity island component n=1 Tax=Kibdelosporangium persicum TaxID=2698649 RepID=A0ABX2FCL8_9PSEU|nr:Clp protease N-terminal domain-containing protein [Kibdelosporangium persicum]NRN68660.1 Clp amino terminal domain-containing protein, pathogenicity island component [Kibdelosporangium persicum]
MFERFSGAARNVVVTAQQVARDAGAGEIDSPDLLVALLRTRDDMIAHLLAGYELSADGLAEEFAKARRRGGMTEADLAALSSFGVDADSVIRGVEQTLGEQALAMPVRKRRFLKGHIPFSSEAKRTLAQCLQEALNRNQREIGAEHLLLALLTGRTLASEALQAKGVTYQGVSDQLAKAS